MAPSHPGSAGGRLTLNAAGFFVVVQKCWVPPFGTTSERNLNSLFIMNSDGEDEEQVDYRGVASSSRLPLLPIWCAISVIWRAVPVHSWTAKALSSTGCSCNAEPPYYMWELAFLGRRFAFCACAVGLRDYPFAQSVRRLALCASRHGCLLPWVA